MLVSTSLWVSCVWLVIYGVKYSSKCSKPVLPLSQGRRPITDVTVRNLNLRIKTQAFNGYHDKLSTSLSLSGSRHSRQVLLWLYDFGSVVSLVGTLTALGLLAWTAITLFMTVLEKRSTLATGALSKRGMEHLSTYVLSPTPASDPLAVNLIIPGVTVPLGHLPMIILALGISQIVHEIGHAFTAALHHVPILSSGVAIAVIVPSAFVVLPTARLDELFPRARMRVVAAGCFHNFTFWCLLVFAAWAQVGTVFTTIFFQDVSSHGKVIIGIDHDSPLTTYLPVGAFVIQLDDVEMNKVGVEAKGDPWDEYLLNPSPALTRGWCVDTSLLNNVSDFSTHCAPTGLHSCFVLFDNSSLQYSLDPVSILAMDTARCDSNVECVSPSLCLVPRRDEQLLRITVGLGFGSDRNKKVVLWKGPKREIWEQVQVGDILPRFSFIPAKLRDVVANFVEYLKVTNLSLYLFNMLPLPALDGSQLLVILLDLVFSRTSRVMDNVDIETQIGQRPVSRTARALRALLSTGAVFLLSLCLLLGIVKWIRE